MAGVSSVLLSTDFEAAIARSQRRTVVLFLVLLLISAALGYVLGWGIAILTLVGSMPPAAAKGLTVGGVLLDLLGPPRPAALIGLAIMLLAGNLWGLITLVAGSRIVNAFAGAREANPNDPVERRLIDVIEEMAIAAGLPAPRAMVIPTPALNAFATGSSPSRAAITATTGLLEACTRDELQGVIGHEMGHVADYDVLYTTIVAAMVGLMTFVAHGLRDIVRWSLNWGPSPGYSSRSGSDGGSDGGGRQRLLITGVVVVFLVIVAAVAFIASRLVQMAISRQREYLADATSAKLTRNPIGLIHALERLQQADTNIARSNSPVSALCIAEPEAGVAQPAGFHPGPPRNGDFKPTRVSRRPERGQVDIARVDP